MKVLLQNYDASASYGYPSQNAALFFMTGTVPLTPAAFNATIDMSSMSNLHSACLGCAYTTSSVSQNSSSFAFNRTYTYSVANYSWLKGGTIPVTGYYIYPPSRVYYTSGRSNSFIAMPPYLFAMPIDCVTGSASMNACMSYRDPSTSGVAYSAYAAGSEIVYTVEYDLATTISALRVSQGATIGGAYVQDFEIDYWNTTTNAWTAIRYASGTAVLAANSVSTVTFTATTATKFRIVLYPNTCVAAYNVLNLTGIALMHTADRTSTSVTGTITWGILMLMPSASTNFWTWRSDLQTTLNPAAVDEVTNMNTLESSMQLLIGSSVIKNPPFIVDTASATASSGKFWITAASSLTTATRPYLNSYIYKSGDLQ